MDLRKFGDSDLILSRMGLGLAALGRPGYINLGHREDLQADYDEQKMEAQTHKMLSEARRLGVNYYDVAQSYGKAEAFLSSWLKENPEEEVIVGSKWGYYYTAGWAADAEKHEIKDHTITRLNQQWPESRERLAPQLKLYQIHSATFESGVLENKEVLERLEEIKAEGYIIGLSLSGSQQGEVLEKALTIIVNEEPLFGSVQATYNVLECNAGGSLQKAHDGGLGVIIKEGLANGRLTSRSGAADFISVVRPMAQNHGVGIDAIALAHILSKPFVDVVLSGATVIDHLHANLQAIKVNLSAKEVAVLEKLKMRSDQYWEERSKLEWN